MTTVKTEKAFTEEQATAICAKLITGLEALIVELSDSSLTSFDLEFCYKDPIGALGLNQDPESMTYQEELEESKKYEEKFKDLFGFTMTTYDCNLYGFGLNQYETAVAWLFTTNVTGRPFFASHKVSKEFWIEQAKYVIKELSEV